MRIYYEGPHVYDRLRPRPHGHETGCIGEAVTEPWKRSPQTVTGPKVGRSADETLWGAKRLHVYVLYDNFLITMKP